MLARRLTVLALAAMLLVYATTAAEGDAEEERFSELRDFTTSETEDVKLHRERRQLRRNPNIFGLLFQLIGETRRDIQRTFNEIARTVESGIVDENTIANSTATAAEGDGGTSERPRVTRQELTRIVSRNWRGLTRLFNQEVEIAVNQSNRNAAEARRAFWDSLAPFLQPATTTARTTTTTTTAPSG